MKKNAKWNWDERQKKAVRALVRLLLAERWCISTKTFQLIPSHFGLEAVSAQKLDGEVKPVVFLSRALSED
jgi:hypothetical protein